MAWREALALCVGPDVGMLPAAPLPCVGSRRGQALSGPRPLPLQALPAPLWSVEAHSSYCLNKPKDNGEHLLDAVGGRLQAVPSDRGVTGQQVSKHPSVGEGAAAKVPAWPSRASRCGLGQAAWGSDPTSYQALRPPG